MTDIDVSNDQRPRDDYGPLYCWCGARTIKRMVGRRMGRYCLKGHDRELSDAARAYRKESS